MSEQSSNNQSLALWNSISQQIEGKYLFGHSETLLFALIAYLSGGHVLIEGPPGTGKTIITQLLSKVLAKSFKRIQFTSDLLPADILGASMYSPNDQGFQFIPGPIFADFILADEINRTPPRTQSALLEAMEEKRVTVEGKTYELSKHFFVMATQNPREFEGTFPLPEAQLDRFLFKVRVNHLDLETEQEMLHAVLNGVLPPPLDAITPAVFDQQSIDEEISQVTVDKSLHQYVAQIVDKTRHHPMLEWGSSFRGGMALVRSARVLALLSGRSYVIPDDIQRLTPVALGHRIKLAPEALMSDASDKKILADIVQSIPFPT